MVAAGLQSLNRALAVLLAVVLVQLALSFQSPETDLNAHDMPQLLIQVVCGRIAGRVRIFV